MKFWNENDIIANKVKTNILLFITFMFHRNWLTASCL